MNESNRQSTLLWGTARALTIGVVERLQYNRMRYKNDGPAPAEVQDLKDTTDQLLLNIQSYKNVVYQYRQNENSAFITGAFILLHKIHNDLYKLHHNLLERDADSILSAIRILDHQRKLWNPGRYEKEENLPSINLALESSREIHRLRELIEGL